MLEAADGLRMCIKDCDFHNDQKTVYQRFKMYDTAVTEKLTPSEVKFKQKILYSYAPTISKRSRLDSDVPVIAKADTATLSDDNYDYRFSQCPLKDSLLQIDDEHLCHNHYK